MSDSRNSNGSSDYWRYPSNPSADMVLIHVIDEHRKLNKDYCCQRKLMLKHMRYFAEYLTEDRTYDDVDISVHCDSDIFEWLLMYIHDPDNPPPLDKNRVVSVLISSEFLLMDQLVELCLDYFVAHLTDVIRLPIDLSCLSDRMLNGLAQRCTAQQLAAARDKKGKLLHKLYKRRADIDFSNTAGAGLVQCCQCGLVYPDEAGPSLFCPNGNVIVDTHGALVSRHERITPSQWSLFEHVRAMQQAPLMWECIYWYLWAACRVIKGQHIAVSALQVDRYMVDDITIHIQQPTYTSKPLDTGDGYLGFQLNCDTSSNGVSIAQDQVNASSFGLGDVMLLKSQGKHIAAAYSTLQELYRQQIIANSIPMPVIQRDKSETPISSDCDGDDTSEEPPPRTPPERPLSRGRSHQRDAFPRRGMRPVSADKNGVALLGSGAHGRTPHSPAQPRRRSRSLSSGFVRRLESSLSLQQKTERELANRVNIFTQLPGESGQTQFLNGVFIGPHPLSNMPRAYFSRLKRAQSSNCSDDKKRQWELDLLREFDDKRLLKLQQKIAQARKAFHESGVPDSDEDATEDTPHRRRRGHVRKDSVTPEMLQEQAEHLRRMKDVPVDETLVKSFKALTLGRRRKDDKLYKPISPRQPKQTHALTSIGAGGVAVHVGSAFHSWPMFNHLLPEIAFAGHSNCGKSTLINALAGVEPRKGPAAVSDRAGWTEKIEFYRIGKKPPVLTLVDFPGYGHAVAAAAVKKHWQAMIRSYLSERLILSRCCVLVDCSRGLCQGDKQFLKYLSRSRLGYQYQVVLTKGDMLTAEELAQSYALVKDDLKPFKGILDEMPVVSAGTGAGIDELWQSILGCAHDTSVNLPPPRVRVHKNAPALVREHLLQR